MDDETRVFYVVDSIEDNEEVFETYEQAAKWFNSLSPVRTEDEAGETNHRRIYVGFVNHAYKEDDATIIAMNGGWNYDDYSDTFEVIKVIQEDE